MKPPAHDEGELRPFRELKNTGLLWLINSVLFHPRGYALDLIWPSDKLNNDEPIGWILRDNGSEPFVTSELPQVLLDNGVSPLDEIFRRANELLNG